MQSKPEETKALHQKLLQQLKESGNLDLGFFSKSSLEPGENISRENLKKVFQLVSKENLEREEKDLKIDTFELKKKIAAVVPAFPQNEFQFFTGGKTEFEFEDLYNQLNENQLGDFDALKEGFKVLSSPEGQLDFEKLSNVSQKLGYGEVSHRDMKILLECMDLDKDGLISLEDFQGLVDYLQ